MICGLNIHYGFIGKAVGFTEWELTAEAGVAQLKDNNRNLGAWVSQYILNRIRELWDADFLAAFDDASDNEAIKIGFRLWSQATLAETKYSEAKAKTKTAVYECITYN